MLGPVGHVVVVAVAGVLGGEAAAGAHVLEVQRLHLQHRLDPLHRNHVDLNNTVLYNKCLQYV